MSSEALDEVDRGILHQALFAPTVQGTTRTGTIEFSYWGYVITVHCDDGVSVSLEERIPSI